jgi:hypothetical protein
MNVFNLNSFMTNNKLLLIGSFTFCVAFSTLALQGCSESSSEKENSTSSTDFEADTSYLDDLAEDQGIEVQDVPAESTANQTQTQAPDKPEKQYEDEEREWVAEEGSKSLLGRSRDRGKDIRDQIQNSTTPQNGIANTTFDEEYAQAAGFAWDMPDGWRMAVPASAYFAEMYIQNPLGNASVVFSKSTDPISQIKRSLESNITDTFGGTSRTKTTKQTVMDYQITVFDLEGTYLDPSGKGNRNGSPFYAIHAAVIELPTTKVVIKMWGPQDTVSQNLGKFDAMIKKMYER